MVIFSMVIFDFVSPTHSCVIVIWNQYVNLVFICACDDRINLSSTFTLLGKCHCLIVENDT